MTISDEKKRIMVMNMPILSPPLTLLENDISLDKSLLPVMVPHDFRVHRNKTNAIDIKQGKTLVIQKFALHKSQMGCFVRVWNLIK